VRGKDVSIEVSGWGIVALASAGTAQGAAVLEDFALEVDTFAALGADNARTFKTGQVFRKDFDFHPFLGEKNVVGELSVGFLLAFFPGEVGKQLLCGLLGRFFGGNANGAAGFEVAERGGDFAPVAELQGALAQAAIGNQRDRVRDAAIDFHVGNKALAVGDGIRDAEFAKAEHCEANAENLASADVAVGDDGEFEVFGEGFHVAVIFVSIARIIRCQQTRQK
jgi:hypothetical protein